MVTRQEMLIQSGILNPDGSKKIGLK